MEILMLFLIPVCVVSLYGWSRRYVNVLTLLEYMRSVSCPPPDEDVLRECEKAAIDKLVHKVLRNE